MAGEALEIHLRGRLREGEVVGAEAHDRLLAVEPLCEHLQRALEVGHRNAAVDHEPLDLVEEGGVGRVHRVGAVDPSGRDDADGGLLLFHRAHLHRGGLGAQQDVVADVEGVLRVARRVVLRNVERLEVVVVGLDLRAFGHREAHAEEDLLDLFEHLGQRVELAERRGPAGHRHVELFERELLVEQGRLDRGGALLDERLDARTHLVGELPDLRALLGRELAHLLEDDGELPLLAEVFDPQVVERLEVAGLRQRIGRLLSDLLQRV